MKILWITVLSLIFTAGAAHAALEDFFDDLTNYGSPSPTPVTKPIDAKEIAPKATPQKTPEPTAVPTIASLENLQPEKPLFVAMGGTQGTLTVVIQNFRSDQGDVRVSLFNGKDGFPGKTGKALQNKFEKIQNNRSTVVFTNVPFGTYALAAYHDENGNGKMDTNLLGMPKEGVAASNDVKGVFGRPKFDKASFKFEARDMTMTLKLTY